jgi:hypothetical protein
MVNVEATIYDTAALAEAALDALDTSVQAHVEAYEDRGVTKWMVVVTGPAKTDFFKTGFNADVDAAEEDLWSVGGSYVFPDAEMGMEVVSSSADDTATDGTGARTVKFWYLNSSGVEKSEIVTLDGVTPVATTATDIYRVNAFRVLTAGAGGKAAGDIDIRHVDDTPIYSRIPVGYTRARNSIYTVPAGKTLCISQVMFSAGSSSGGHYCRFTLNASYDDKIGVVSSMFYPYYEIGIEDGAFESCVDTPVKLPAMTDVKISVVGDATNANAICTGSYRGWLE